jgi:hypothetical protein
MISKDFFVETADNVYPQRRRAWDEYNAFHIRAGVFTEFESGEMMVNTTPHPDGRKFYPEYNVQLATTTDKDCPKLYFDKECTQPVKKAWVTQHGHQHLAIDYERKVAIALFEGWRHHQPTILGDHVNTASAYWAGQERLPVPLAKIKVQTPDPEYKKKMVNVLNEVRAAVAAIHRMNDDGASNWWYESQHMAKEEWQDSSTSDIIAELSQDKQVMYNIATKGFEYPRKTQEMEFLYVKPREE